MHKYITGVFHQYITRFYDFTLILQDWCILQVFLYITGEPPPPDLLYVHGGERLDLLAGVHHVQQVQGKISTNYSIRSVVMLWKTLVVTHCSACYSISDSQDYLSI